MNGTETQAGGRTYRSVVRDSEFKSEDPGFDPPLEETLLFLPDPPPPPPPFVCTAHTKFVRTLKIPYPSVAKGYRPHHSRCYGSTKTLHTGNKEKKCWVAPYNGCSLSPGGEGGGSSPDFPCIVLGQEGYQIDRIKSNQHNSV